MSDAPERIWALHYECEDEPDAIAIGYPEKFFGTHEYVRAARIEELERKLAKVVEGLHYYACNCVIPCEQLNGSCGDMARTALSELKAEDRG
jgi:hypothetical protein